MLFHKTFCSRTIHWSCTLQEPLNSTMSPTAYSLPNRLLLLHWGPSFPKGLELNSNFFSDLLFPACSQFLFFSLFKKKSHFWIFSSLTVQLTWAAEPINWSKPVHPKWRRLHRVLRSALLQQFTITEILLSQLLSGETSAALEAADM